LRTRRRNLLRSFALGRQGCVAALLLAITNAGWFAAAATAAPQDCVKAEIILWGDGKHDDTAALSAWLRGANATWAVSGKPVGARIVGHSFRLTSAVYVSAGTGRQLDDFRLLFPERGEVVSGGTIITGDDPDKAPVLSGVSIRGGDSGEGVPFDLPDLRSGSRPSEASCAIS
jgi:hypothetical protein